MASTERLAAVESDRAKGSSSDSSKSSNQNRSIDELLASCNSLIPEDLFIFAKILCGDYSDGIKEGATIQKDRASAWYLAQIAYLLAKSQDIKIKIKEFIEKEGLEEIKSSQQLLYSLGLTSRIKGVIYVKNLYYQVRDKYPDKETPTNGERPKGGGTQNSRSGFTQQPRQNEEQVDVEMSVFKGGEERSADAHELKLPEDESVFGSAIQFVKDHPAPFIILGIGLCIGMALATPVVGPALLTGLIITATAIKIAAVTSGMAIAHHAISSTLAVAGAVLLITMGCKLTNQGFFARKIVEDEKHLPQRLFAPNI